MADVIPVPVSWSKKAHCDNDSYMKMYEQSVKDPEGFWGKIAKRIDWFQPFSKVKDGDFTGDIRIRWFIDGKLNVSYNCLDRHLEKEATRLPSSGKVMIRGRAGKSPIERCTSKSVSSRMCSSLLG